MNFLYKTRNYLAQKPVIFSFLRQIFELNFRKQKMLIKETIGKDSEDKKILDIGCGTGAFARLFEKENYFGIDILPDYIEYAKKNNKGSFQVMDATDLKFPNEHFDRVLIMAVLHHLNDEDSNKVIREAKRVLKPNGQILIMEDAKIPRLESALARFTQKFDKGEFIRTPKNYKKIIKPHLKILKESEFKNGACVYFGMFLEKKQ
ncbi:class I SAM-dependent methyltransferase [Patescibacteria group bacterium]|nr:class I SAM-dependent methyltransferase [Patescibacteria group bacterium]MBU4579756.1 class I SAM-dependent methyltransferase [Patescibacteria group bacterium]